MNILILGSEGLLGSYLSEYFKKHFVVYRSSKKSGKFKVNLLDKSKLKSLFLKISPDVIINCTGATDTQKCIQNKKYAYRGNCLTVKNIISTLNEGKIKSHLIHISTDQVYSGKNNEKNLEHKVSTTNNYSKSKYAGELETKKYRKTTIVRSNFFGPCPSAKKKSFSEFILNQTISGKTVRLPKNIIFSPISLVVFSKILFTIVKKKIIGTYNVGSSNKIDKYRFGILLCKKFKLPNNKIIPFNSHYGQQKRPLNTCMSILKIQKKILFKIPSVEKMINNYL